MVGSGFHLRLDAGRVRLRVVRDRRVLAPDPGLESLHRLEEPKVARVNLLSAGRNLRMRSDAARLLDSFDHGVRTRYPYPLAYRWRRVEAAMSSGDSIRAYDALLEAAEVLHCYGANLAMVMARLAGQELKSLDWLREKLSARASGATFGDWISILQEVNGKKFRILPHDLPLGEVRFLFEDDSSKAAQARIVERRNDRAHMRNSDIEKLVDSTHADLALLMSSAEALTDLTLIHVDSVQWDAFEGRSILGYGELMGDHSVVPLQEISYDESGIEVGSLYALDTSHRLHLLRPFLVGRHCPTCTNRSTFHVDRALSDGSILMKSLEHGHTLVDDSIGPTLKQAGL